MICLGIDSAGKAASVAIMRDGQIIYDMMSLAGRTHSETLLSHVKSALCTLNLNMQDVDLIGVNCGPGSFTGLRIGLALAKGLAAPRSIPCVGTSTTDSLARCISANGNILCALDARRGEVYYALFKRENGLLTRACPDNAAKAEDVKLLLADMDKPIYITGDGCKLFCDIVLDENGIFYADNAVINGRAYGVCLAASEAFALGKSLNAEDLCPEYLRLSQAQRERIEKEQKSE